MECYIINLLYNEIECYQSTLDENDDNFNFSGGFLIKIEILILSQMEILLVPYGYF